MQPTQNDRFPVKKVQLQLPTGSGPSIGSIFIGIFCFLFAGVALAFASVANLQMDSANVLAFPLALIALAASLVNSMPFVLAGTLVATIGITLVIAK